MSLAKYKKAWKKQPEDHDKISISEIYRMTQSKSTSIVKWIFIIGIIEFIFMNSLSLIFYDDTATQREMIEKFGMTAVIHIIQIITYLITLYFLYMFYKNYKEISVTDATKSLMSKIIQTRKTVRNYVIFNLSFVVFISILMVIASLRTEYSHFDTKQSAIFILSMLIAIVLMVFIFWLFYQLLYGILLRKLKINYKNLLELESK